MSLNIGFSYNRYRECIFSIVLFFFFFLIIYLTRYINLLVVNTTVNARFWPKIIGYSGCILSIFLFVQKVFELRKLKKIENVRIEQGVSDRHMIKADKFRSMKTLGLMFFYIFGLKHFGFFIMTTVYLYFQFNVLEEKEKRNWKKLLVISIIFPLIVFIVFRFGFKVLLPDGSVWSFFVSLL